MPAADALPIHRETAQDGSIVLRFEHSLKLSQVERMWSRLDALLAGATKVRLNVSDLRELDSSGLALIMEIQSRVPAVEFTPAPEIIQGLFKFIEPEPPRPAAPARRRSDPFTLLGAGVVEFLREIRRVLLFVGEATPALLWTLVRPWRLLKGADFWYYLARSGPDAVGIAALISFMMGLTLSFQSAQILPSYGAETFLANVVAYSFVRELGPVVTAIVMAGRSGAAFAAEIGTMKVNEEVDAMTTLGFPVFHYLVIPKVLALSLTLPCLVLLSDVLGIGAGFLVARGVLQFSFETYWNQTVSAIDLGDVLTGLFKSWVFGLAVAGIGCHRGFQTRTGAKGVGESATTAVVNGIFLIILLDAIFSVIFYTLDI